MTFQTKFDFFFGLILLIDSLHTHFRVGNLMGLDKHVQSCNGHSVATENVSLTQEGSLCPR